MQGVMETLAVFSNRLLLWRAIFEKPVGTSNPHKDHVEDHVALAMTRWNGLYSDLSHARLQNALMNHIAAGYIAYKKATV